MIRKILLLFFIFFCCGVSYAIPVEDYGEWIRTAQEIKQLSQSYFMLKNQYETLKNQYATMTGHYGYGNYLDTHRDLQDREWSPNTWEDALKGLSGGNRARYQELLNQYQKNHETLSRNDYQNATSKGEADLYQQQINTNRAAEVNSTFAFNTIQSSLDTVHALSQKIETTKNTKAAMDLNARLLAELAYIQIQELKMQAIMNEQLSEQTGESIAEKTAAAKFNE